MGEAKAPRILILDHVQGSVEIAEDADTEARTITEPKGVRMLTTGAYLKVPEGSWIRLKYRKRKGPVLIIGPAEVEIEGARLQRSSSGIHGKVEEIHATFLLNSGILAGAMEGPVETRPSIEVSTPRASMQFGHLGVFAVVCWPKEKPEQKELEYWLRDGRGEGEPKILTPGGKTTDFPAFGMVRFYKEDEKDKVRIESDSREFVEGFLQRVETGTPYLPPRSQLEGELDWKELR